MELNVRSVHNSCCVFLELVRGVPKFVLNFPTATATLISCIISSDQVGGWSLTLDNYPLKGNGGK